MTNQRTRKKNENSSGRAKRFEAGKVLFMGNKIMALT
jgi:hypothetical protein